MSSTINGNKIKYDDFVGFTFDDIHSSELHVIRTSEGNRYTNNLLPSFQDKTVQVGGRNGTYLFGSNYQKQEFPIAIAFDNVSEEELRRIQNWGADQKIHKLILDETPYKYYNVKLANPPQLKYICFDESENIFTEPRKGDINRRKRIYKGEGTFKFVCYETFARGYIKTKEEIKNKTVDHIQVYLDKNLTQPFELQINDLTGIDTVALYLNRDLYKRGNWGAPNLDDRSLPESGQLDPHTGLPSSSYYIYQPQRIKMAKLDGDSAAALTSDYQLYLFPIDFKKGFVGSIDQNTLVTDGKIINRPFQEGINDGDYDFNYEQKRTELVQYDPQLKVTYGISSDSLNKKQGEYGCYKLLLDENNQPYKIENKYAYTQIKAIEKDVAEWKNDTLKIIDQAKESGTVYGSVIDTLTNLENNIFTDEVLTWSLDKKNQIFVVKEAPNTLISDCHHSIYILPNDTKMEYELEVRYNERKDELGNYTYNKIPIHISLVDKEDSMMSIDVDGAPVEEGYYINYYEGIYNNYIEWAKTIALPETDSIWENKIYKIYNPGDLSMPFIIEIEATNKTIKANTFQLKDINGDVLNELQIEEFTLLGDDECISIDSNLRVIQGCKKNENDDYIPTGNVYDRYIVRGDYFYIPCGEYELVLENMESMSKRGKAGPYISYEYRYF